MTIAFQLNSCNAYDSALVGPPASEVDPTCVLTTCVRLFVCFSFSGCPIGSKVCPSRTHFVAKISQRRGLVCGFESDGRRLSVARDRSEGRCCRSLPCHFHVLNNTPWQSLVFTTAATDCCPIHHPTDVDIDTTSGWRCRGFRQRRVLQFQGSFCRSLVR